MSHSFVIHFLHPPSGRTLSYVAPPDGPVDLGTIARTFSLDPVSVRFNAHFISRNAHFISSLTWRQVLNFFERRGYDSGKDSENPVRVEGRFLLRNSNEDANVAVSEEAASEHMHPRKLKRKPQEAEFSLSSTSEKRIRRENITGTTSSMAEATLFSPKLKRRPHEDAVQSSTKRIRCEGSSDDGLVSIDGEISQDQENKHWDGSRRHVTGVDGSTYTALWKRVKEIRV